MKRIQTHISFAQYESKMKNFEVMGLESSEWYKLLVPALEELKNEDLAQFIISLDYYVSANLLTGKKFSGAQILFFKEYIKRVLNFDEIERKRLQEYEVAQKKAREALNALRIEQMKDKKWTGIQPGPKHPDDLCSEDELQERIDFHCLNCHLQKTNRASVDYHTKEARRLFEILQMKKRIRYWKF